MSRRNLLLSLPLVLAASISAQDRIDRAEARRLKEQKLKAPFLQNGDWVTDFSAAVEQARATDQAILVYFTRSHPPSRPCEDLEQGFLRSPGFRSATKQFVRVCVVASGLPADAFTGRLAQIAPERVPAIKFLDPEALPLGEVSAVGNPDSMRKLLDETVRPYMKLRQMAKEGDKPAKARILLTRLQLGHYSPTEVRKLLDEADYLTPEQRQRVESGLLSLELMELLARVDPEKPSTTEFAVKRILHLHAKGRHPKGPMAGPYWRVILTHAEKIENVDLFAEALQMLERTVGREVNPEFFGRMEDRLRAMRFLQGRRKTEKPKKGR